MFTRIFWRDTIERAISTAAQFLLAGIGGQAADKLVGGWEVLAAAAATGFALTVIKSLAAASFGDKESASFTVRTAPPSIVEPTKKR